MGRVAGCRVGILTSEGGKASHAALVARGMGRPAVTGAAAMDIDLKAGEVRIGEHVLHAGDFIAIDGTNGAITTDDVPLVETQIDARFETVLRWADELREIGVRANADTPEDAARAHRFGAEMGCAGPSTCSWPLIASLEDAGDDHGRGRGRPAGRARRSCSRSSSSDFEGGVFEAMAGWPVTIRLLDPPLHEFLPRTALRELNEADRARADQPLSAASWRDSSASSIGCDRWRPIRCWDPRGVRLRRDGAGGVRDAGAGDRPCRACGA